MAYAGLFNEPIDIYDITSTRNDFGEKVETYTKTYSTRAKVGHIGGSRQVINNEIVTPYQKNFVVRIYVPVSDTARVKYKDKFYQVTSFDKDISLQQTTIITELVNE